MDQKIVNRRKFIESHVDIGNKAILELGPLVSPTYRPHEADIKYLDWFTTEELLEFIKTTPFRNPKNLVPIDYAIKCAEFADKLDRKFDLIIAHHVIEHIPDPIRWIQELHKALNPGGGVFLSIPDRKRTFDILRRDSNAVEMLRSYEEKLEVPTYYQILDHLYYWRPIKPEDTWTGEDLTAKKANKRYTLPEAMEEARRLLGTDPSTHISVFQRETFEALWSDLMETGLLPMDIAAIADVPEGANEFHVLLKAVE